MYIFHISEFFFKDQGNRKWSNSLPRLALRCWLVLLRASCQPGPVFVYWPVERSHINVLTRYWLFSAELRQLYLLCLFNHHFICWWNPPCLTNFQHMKYRHFSLYYFFSDFFYISLLSFIILLFPAFMLSGPVTFFLLLSFLEIPFSTFLSTTFALWKLLRTDLALFPNEGDYFWKKRPI